MIYILMLGLVVSRHVWDVSAECANACYGHGVCTAYDMCVCERNWQANDCSERTCQFGLAFVDTPKGDLDGSGTLSGPNERVVRNSASYPYGTSESFPGVEDSSFRRIDNSAHAYMECSNSGRCNRQTGACECFEGFDGAACQRSSCPGHPDDICNGHGVCANVRSTAKVDSGNSYELWDRNTIVGCVCDKGFGGGDCSLRWCPYGMDPTYMYDDSATVRYPIFNLAVMSTAASYDFYDGAAQASTGKWAISFYDLLGNAWLTEPLVAGASCAKVVAALEGLPNSLVPSGSISCMFDAVLYKDPLDNTTSDFQELYLSRWIYVRNETFLPKNNTVEWRPTFWAAGFKNSYDYKTASDPRLTGYIYRLEMLGNPGAYLPPVVQTFLGDGQRTSLASQTGTLLTRVWSDGRQGESVEYFPSHCSHVKVQVQHVGTYYFLTGFNATEKQWLQACLGQADKDPAAQVAAGDTTTINWDYGTKYNPHLVKLVRLSTDHADGGYFVTLVFDTAVHGLDKTSSLDGTFHLLNPFHPLDYGDLDWFDVFTGKGILQMVSEYSDAFFDFASTNIFSANLGYDIYGEEFDGDVSCDPNPNSPNRAAYRLDCLQKGDKFFLLDPLNSAYNPSFLNMYTVQRIYQQPYTLDVGVKLGIWPSPDIAFTPRLGSVRTPSLTAAMRALTYTIESDVATNWAQDITGAAAFKLFKFIPDPGSSYEYVAQCSNRGICNTYDGICDCFAGYAGRACDTQDALAL